MSTLGRVVQRVKQEGQDYFFPVFCFVCEREGEWLCAACMEDTIPLSGVWCCPVCHAVQPYGMCCSACIEQSSLSRHIAITPYAEQARISMLLHAIKYQYAEDAFSVIARLVKMFMVEHAELFASVDAVVAVPLHRRRYAERGFNQAEVIARFIAFALDKPMLPALKRVRATRQQALLSRDERHKNMDEAFAVAGDITGKVLLLVDDVYTTGSTMQVGAKALHDAGAGDIQGFSIARG